MFAATALGTLAGIWIGAIPGLSVTMAVSILVSFTFAWELEPALALMAGVFTGGVYGGSRSAILLNIPGAPAAIATALDGYPMARRGEAGAAIGLTTLASFLGGMIGVAALALGAPAIAEVAILFAPRDYLLLAVLGLLLVGSLSGESLAKGLFAASLGIALGLVGLDPMTAEPRFTYGSVELLGGIPYVAAMIGLFGVAEALSQLRLHDAEPVRLRQALQHRARVVPGLDVLPDALEVLGERLGQPCAGRRDPHQRLVGLVLAAAVGELEVEPAPAPPVLLAARHAVPHRPRIEQAREQVEEDGAVALLH